MKKMKQNNKIIMIIIAIISFLTVIYLITSPKKKNQEPPQKQASISELKYEIGAMGEEDLYETKKDEKGKEVLAIKKELLYKVALAGILKKQKPTFEELDETIKQANLKSESGIWISQEARKDIASMLQDYLKDSYQINEERLLAIRKENAEMPINMMKFSKNV